MGARELCHTPPHAPSKGTYRRTHTETRLWCGYLNLKLEVVACITNDDIMRSRIGEVREKLKVNRRQRNVSRQWGEGCFSLLTHH